MLISSNIDFRTWDTDRYEEEHNEKGPIFFQDNNHPKYVCGYSLHMKQALKENLMEKRNKTIFIA